MAHVSSKIRAKLKTSRVARLSTVDAEGGAHAVPVCFVYVAGVFYSAIDRKPKRVVAGQLARVKNIRKTPRVALLVDHYDEDWARLWYVLVRGVAEIVSSAGERKRALRLLKAKYPQYRSNLLGDDAPVLRITPRRVVAWGDI